MNNIKNLGPLFNRRKIHNIEFNIKLTDLQLSKLRNIILKNNCHPRMAVDYIIG